MGWPSRSRRRGLSSAALILLLFLFLAAAAARTGTCSPVGRGRAAGGLTPEEYSWADPGTSGSRRGLVGPGSSPPTCRSRCGGCRPCRPVHVAIQPGRSFPLEYYPEAWRCKCGNRLFMP